MIFKSRSTPPKLSQRSRRSTASCSPMTIVRSGVSSQFFTPRNDVQLDFARHLPLSLRHEVTKELQNLERLGGITPVPIISFRTPAAPVVKDSALRLLPHNAKRSANSQTVPIHHTERTACGALCGKLLLFPLFYIQSIIKGTDMSRDERTIYTLSSLLRGSLPKRSLLKAFRCTTALGYPWRDLFELFPILMF